MASTDEGGAMLMNLPLEIRHNIYEAASVRTDKTKKVLRRWFEKKEVKETIAKQAACNPNAVIPQPVYDDEFEEDSEAEEEDDDDNDDDNDNDEENGDDSDDGDGDGDDDDGDGDDDDDQDEATEDNGGDQAGPQRVPIIRPSPKWRHIPKFLRISHSPPPPALLLTSRALNRQAKDWFYDVAVISIDATGSFAHTSMFEESLQQIADAAFSPFENIRKVEVTFVWDTLWLRATHEALDDIFHALLGMRANIVIQILRQAPDLKQVTVHWHDSIEDVTSSDLRDQIVLPFLELPADINVVPHYLNEGEKPHRNTLAGKKRLEFQAIVDDGMTIF